MPWEWVIPVVEIGFKMGVYLHWQWVNSVVGNTRSPFVEGPFFEHFLTSCFTQELLNSTMLCSNFVDDMGIFRSLTHGWV